MKKLMFASVLFVLAAPAFAGDHEHMKPVASMPKEFDSLKTLAGTWEGTGMMDGKEQAVTVVYEVTSGGSILVERLMPGTPGEMISVYHRDGKTLSMTHYCALGNQPEM